MSNRRLRSALALGLGLVGLTGLSGDARAFHAIQEHHWPRHSMTNGNGGCRVPYTDELVTGPVRETVNQVLDYINRTTPCVWEPKLWWEQDYVAITENGLTWDWFLDHASFANGVGRWGGRQEMKICHGCNEFGHILHEMGHSMGLLHEHQRQDRDNYVNVYPQYAQGSAQQAFHISYLGETLGYPYDTTSIMHYSGWDFYDPLADPFCVFTGCRTIKKKNGDDPGPITQFFTAYDVEGLKRRYPVPQRLTAMHSGKCIEIPASMVDPPGSHPQQTIVEQFDCHEASNQGWLFKWQENVGGTDYYVIESAHPNAAGLCLDVQSGSQSPSAPVWLWPCTGNHAQQWSRTFAGQNTNGYSLRARHSDQCLDVSWNSQDNSAQLVQFSCTGSENQIWGVNYRPTTIPDPVDPCVPGQRSICEYDPVVRRLICECLPG